MISKGPPKRQSFFFFRGKIHFISYNFYFIFIYLNFCLAFAQIIILNSVMSHVFGGSNIWWYWQLRSQSDYIYIYVCVYMVHGTRAIMPEISEISYSLFRNFPRLLVDKYKLRALINHGNPHCGFLFSSVIITTHHSPYI